LKHVETDEKETVRAKYLFSAEGARSFIRDSLGIQMNHKDQISHVWGVMDGVVRTDFPDIKVEDARFSSTGTLTASVEMHNSFGLRLHHGHSKRSQHGPTVYSSRVLDRQRLGS